MKWKPFLCEYIIRAAKQSPLVWPLNYFIALSSGKRDPSERASVIDRALNAEMTKIALRFASSPN